MTSPIFQNYAGAGQSLSDMFGYSQAVSIPLPGGTLIKCSGQGGWHHDDASITVDASDLDGQIQRAFDNVERILKEAGSKGWEDVILMRTYATEIDEAMPILGKLMKERIGGRRPAWTALSVPNLALKEMRIEIEVEAWVIKA